jgi:hypothetical protein
MASGAAASTAAFAKHAPPAGFGGRREQRMVAAMEIFQRDYFPILVIGLATGLLALIPLVGWLLGFSAFVLAYRYARRKTFLADLAVMLLLWLLVRQLAQFLLAV